MANNGQTNGRARLKWLIVAAVLGAVVLLAAFMSLGRKEVPIRAARAIRGSISSTISTNGKIEPIDNFEAHAPAPTTVTRVLVHEGDQVKADQLLMELDSADARAQAARAQAQLRAAEADLHAVRSGGTREQVLAGQSQLAKAQVQVESARTQFAALQRLQQQGAASKGEVEAAEARLKSAEADLRLAAEKRTSRYSSQEIERVQAQAHEATAALAAADDLLRHSEIRAPRAGIVYSLPVRSGQYVNRGDLLLQVADLTTVNVRGFVDEPDLGRLRAGESVQVTWDALPGRQWQGSVTRVPSTVVALGSRNVGEIGCRVANSDLKLLPNTNVTLNIVTAQAQDVITVPREAVHVENGQRFVYEVVGGRLQRRTVQTSIADLTQVEITQGLAADATVALGSLGGQTLSNGTSVRIVSQ
jgi:HlyD family secretion protein